MSVKLFKSGHIAVSVSERTSAKTDTERPGFLVELQYYFTKSHDKEPPFSCPIPSEEAPKAALLLQEAWAWIREQEQIYAT